MQNKPNSCSIHIHFVPALCALLVLLFFCSGVFAVAQLVALHGRIAQSGSSLSTGDLRVYIYDANVNGNLVYDSGSDFNNAITDGVVDVVLGSNTQLDLNYGGYYYIDLSINGTDLDFNGSERKQFESSHGVVKTGSILDATITNSDISSTASIDWTKISKTGADLNALKWGSDFNSQYARKTADDNVTGAWNFANTLTTQGGFGLGGVTISNGVLYTQSLVILNDLNAATVTAIDVNGNYTPFLDVTWSLGSSSNRWLGIFTRDLNTTDINSTRASIGTLGIGTNSPASLLSVRGSGSASSIVDLVKLTQPNGGNGGVGILFSGSSTSDTDFARITGYDAADSWGGKLGFYTHPADNTAGTAPSLRMTINHDGNVGIGTATPKRTLNVVGDANVTNNLYLDGGSTTRLQFTLGSGHLAGFINAGNFQSGYAENFYSNWQGSTRIAMQQTIDNDGNGGLYAPGNLGVYGVNGLRLATNKTGSAAALRIITGTSSSGNTFVGGTTVLTILGDGNTGIATTLPTQKLDVNGNTRITGDLNVTGTSYLGNIILNATDLNVTNINPGDQNIIFKNTSGGEIARIVGAGGTSGNVGIGTNAPNYALSVFKETSAGPIGYFENRSTGGSVPVLDLRTANQGKQLRVGDYAGDQYTYDIGRLSTDKLQFYANQGGGADIGYIFGGVLGTYMTIDDTGNIVMPNLQTTGEDVAACFIASTGELIEDSTTTCASSSKRYKTDIQPLNYGLNEVLQLKPSSFTLKSNGRRGMGLIAEDVELVMPELVAYDAEGNVDTLHFYDLNGPIIKSIQELNSKISTLEQKNMKLEQEVKTLKEAQG